MLNFTLSRPALALAALAALAAARVEARAARAAPAPNPAVRARAAVMDHFTARMGRLDSLMGPRARSASAEP